MTFLRTKKINNNFYCYLVQNKHTKKGSRQKVKRYLGKAIRFESKKELNFLEFFRIINLEDYFQKNKKQILNDLIKFELVKHDFKEKKNFLINKNFSFNKTNFQILKNQKEIILSLNEGFLCSFTINRIFRFKKSGDFQKDALKLAKYFVEAGIKIPREVFVSYYEKC